MISKLMQFFSSNIKADSRNDSVKNQESLVTNNLTDVQTTPIVDNTNFKFSDTLIQMLNSGRSISSPENQENSPFVQIEKSIETEDGKEVEPFANIKFNSGDNQLFNVDKIPAVITDLNYNVPEYLMQINSFNDFQRPSSTADSTASLETQPDNENNKLPSLAIPLPRGALENQNNLTLNSDLENDNAILNPHPDKLNRTGSEQIVESNLTNDRNASAVKVITNKNTPTYPEYIVNNPNTTQHLRSDENILNKPGDFGKIETATKQQPENNIKDIVQKEIHAIRKLDGLPDISAKQSIDSKERTDYTNHRMNMIEKNDGLIPKQPEVIDMTKINDPKPAEHKTELMSKPEMQAFSRERIFPQILGANFKLPDIASLKIMQQVIEGNPQFKETDLGHSKKIKTNPGLEPQPEFEVKSHTNVTARIEEVAKRNEATGGGNDKGILKQTVSIKQETDSNIQKNYAIPDKKNIDIHTFFDVQTKPRNNTVENISQKPGIDLSMPGKEIDRSVMDQLVKSVSLQIKNNFSEMKVTLRPETLGEIIIKVQVEDGKVNAQIDVGNQATRNILEANSISLKQELRSNGIDIQRIEIFSFGQASAQHSKEGNSFRQKYTVQKNDGHDQIEDVQSSKSYGYNTVEYLM